jgi:hypothetical protein
MEWEITLLNKMDKKILSELALYTGFVKLPNPIKIDLELLRADILLHSISDSDKPFPFSKSLDIMQTYIKDFFQLKYTGRLISKDTFGNTYKPGDFSYPLISVDLMNLKDSCDFAVLYGVNVVKNSCKIRIEYDNNRFKNNYIDVPIETNSFIIIPSTLIYYILPNTSEKINFILTTLYELK